MPVDIGCLNRAGEAVPESRPALVEMLRAQGARGPWLAILSELTRIGGGSPDLVEHTEKSWSSATFSGSRHRFTLAFAGLAGIAAGERWIEAIPDHEFAVPGHLVADAAVISVVHVTVPEPGLTLEAEFLLLDEE